MAIKKMNISDPKLIKTTRPVQTGFKIAVSWVDGWVNGWVDGWVDGARLRIAYSNQKPVPVWKDVWRGDKQFLALLTAFKRNFLTLNIPTLHHTHRQKQLLLKTSANALKICTPTYHDRMSYLELHSINNRATPFQMCTYKHAMFWFQLLNQEIPHVD